MATAWSTPRDWTTAEVVTSAEMNTDVRDNMDWLGTDKPMFAGYNTGLQSISNSVLTAVGLNAELYDNSNMHDTVTNNSRVSIPVTGKYEMSWFISWAINAGGGQRQGRCLVNSATYIAIHSTQPSGTHGSEQTCSLTYPLTAGDYVELVVNQDSGGALNLGANSRFSVTWLGN